MVEEEKQKTEEVIEAKEVKEEPKEEVKESSEEKKVEETKPVEGKRKPWERGKRRFREEVNPIESWEPKTKLGIDVKAEKIKNIDEILNNNIKILESEIVDSLIEVQSDLISVGQSKGKFGGGKRRAWRQTQRKTKEGNVPTFSTMAVVGDMKGHVGIGTGKSMETLPARDKALRKAKLNIIKVTRGDGSFDSVGGGDTSIPFKVEGKSGSVRVVLMPAAPGTGLVVADQLKKILNMAGIKDIYSKTFGKKRTTFNLAKACMKALEKTNLVVER
jgi:small subunit ribosomal protein S5